MASAAQRGRGGGRSGALSMFQANGVVYTEGQEEVMGDGERVFEAPTKAERAMAQYQLELVRRQPDSPYWARQPPQRSDQRDLPRYTDRYHPDRHAIACAASLLQHAPLQHGIFPPQLLANFTSRESRRARQAPRRGRTAPTEIDWDNLQAEEKRTVCRCADPRATAKTKPHPSPSKKIWATTRTRTKTTTPRTTSTMAKTTTTAIVTMVATKPRLTNLYITVALPDRLPVSYTAWPARSATAP